MAGNCLRTANDEIVTTEWEDIQYKFGNKVGKYATREEEIRQQKEMKDIIENVIDNYDPLENRTIEQLDDMLQEDGRGDDDEDALVAYRRARRQEEMERQRGTKFGSIRHISKSEYVDEVSKAGQDTWVLCLLIEEGNAHCEYLLRLMGEVAERNSALKIVSIKSTDAIDKFPASHLPTVLVYNSGEMKKQITTLKPWCKTEARPNLEEVEDYLRTLGPLRNTRRTVESDSDDEEEEADDRAPAAGRIGRSTGKTLYDMSENGDGMKLTSHRCGPIEFRESYPSGMRVSMVREVGNCSFYSIPDEEDESGGSRSTTPNLATEKTTSPTDMKRELPETFGTDLLRRLQKSESNFTYPSAIMNTWRIDNMIMAKLNKGQALFGFSCKLGDQMSSEERSMFSLVINKTTLNTDNALDMSDPVSLRSHTFLLSRGLYILPFLSLEDINIDNFTSPEYHQNCQPKNTTIWTDCAARGDNDTFRITKTIIPWVFKMTVQFKCSLVPDDELENMSPLMDGLKVHKGIFLERTKRGKNTKDMTRSAKSVVLFHDIPGVGLLCANPSFIVNTSIPKVFAMIMDRIGSLGAEEVAETATNTWRYLRKRQLKRDPPSEPKTPTETVLQNKRVKRRIRPPGCSNPSEYSVRTQAVV